NFSGLRRSAAANRHTYLTFCAAAGSELQVARTALADLLAPHRVVQALQLDQFFVLAGFHDPAAFEDEDLIRMNDCREAMRDQNRNQVLAHGNIADSFADLLFRE